MLKAMAQHQANHHPLALVLVMLIFGPFLLAAAAFYITVYAAYRVLWFTVLVAQRAHELRQQQ